jgi:hypothetical protein
MKKHLLYSALVLCLGVTLTGCDDFLNDNRYPLDKQTSSPEFWSNSVNVEGEAFLQQRSRLWLRHKWYFLLPYLIG